MKNLFLLVGALALGSCSLFAKLETPSEAMVVADQSFAKLLQAPDTSFEEWLAANPQLSAEERVIGLRAFESWLFAVQSAEEALGVTPVIGDLYSFPLGSIADAPSVEDFVVPVAPEPAPGLVEDLIEDAEEVVEEVGTVVEDAVEDIGSLLDIPGEQP